MIGRLRWCRRRRALLRSALTLTLTLSLVLSLGLTPTPTRAQNEPPPAGGEGEKGRPLDGYIATGCLVGLVLFLVAKSARRTTSR
jgi:hypothetical protein